jgi:ABC-type antimicrobial peptide transport system permease subunit
LSSRPHALSASFRRSATFLLGLFAAVAVIVGAVGVLGIVACTIGLRTREIGIQLALGATVRRVRSDIVRKNMGIVLIGVALGLAGAAALSRLLSGLVYGISTTDPATLLLTAVILSGVAWLAALLPARRITRLDPVAVQTQNREDQNSQLTPKEGIRGSHSRGSFVNV